MAENTGEDELLVAEIDVSEVQRARLDRPFLRDRRPELYQSLAATVPPHN
jgi:predicted amidohydrolase